MKILNMLVLAVLACQNTLPVNEEDIDEVYNTFTRAYRDLDIELVKRIYADSTVYLTPGNVIQFDKGEFIGSFDSMFAGAKADSAQLDIRFQIRKRDISPAQVTDIGYYRLQRIRQDSIQWTSVGKFITVLKPQSDGTWKFVVDGYSNAPIEAWEKPN